MNVGMLWFDNDPKSELTLKIERAAQYYRNKYGKMPTLCYVHPSMLPATSKNGEESSLKTGPIEVRSNQAVLPHHFWIGVNGSTVDA